MGLLGANSLRRGASFSFQLSGLFHDDYSTWICKSEQTSWLFHHVEEKAPWLHEWSTRLLEHNPVTIGALSKRIRMSLYVVKDFLYHWLVGALQGTKLCPTWSATLESEVPSLHPDTVSMCLECCSGIIFSFQPRSACLWLPLRQVICFSISSATTLGKATKIFQHSASQTLLCKWITWRFLLKYWFKF